MPRLGTRRRGKRYVVVVSWWWCVCLKEIKALGEKNVHARARSQTTRTTKTRFRKRRHFSSFFRSSVRDPMRRDGPNKRGRRKPRRLLRERKRKNPIRRAFLPKRRRMLSRTINLFFSDHSLTCFSPSLSLSLSHTHRRNHFVPTAPIPTGPRPGTRARRDF